MNALVGLLTAIPGDVWLGIIIGAAAAYPIGMWRAEVGIAKHGMERTWKGRSSWRAKDN